MRLFVAIDAPEAWRREAVDLQQGLPDHLQRAARLVGPENMHVTLRFIGEVSEPDLPALQDSLEATLPPIGVVLRLGPAGTFGSASRTSSVYLKVEGDLEGLRNLHERTNRAVETALGLPFDEGRYTPHVTLWRVRNRVDAGTRRQMHEYVQGVPHPEPAEFTVREAILVRSHLSGDGPRYEAISRYS